MKEDRGIPGPPLLEWQTRGTKGYTSSMKKPQNFLDLHLTLPEAFPKTIQEAMEEEFTVACRKWNLALNFEDRKAILYHATRQLEGKVSTSSHSKWTLTSRELTVSVRKAGGERASLSLPSPEAAESSLNIVRDHTEWKVDQDPIKDSIPLGDFYDHLLATMVAWARTAVFYGVGSYNL